MDAAIDVVSCNNVVSSASIVLAFVSKIPTSVTLTFTSSSMSLIVHSETSPRTRTSLGGPMKVVVSPPQPPPKPVVYSFSTNRTTVAGRPTVADNLQHMFEQHTTLSNRLIEIESKYDEMMAQFKGEIMRLESKIYVQERVSDALREEVDRLQQYTRRPCVTIRGIDKANNEKFADLKQKVAHIIQSVNSSTTINDVDKFHRNGRVRDGKQEVIIRFKSHSAKEAFYKARKEQQNVVIYPSLTKKRLTLLHEARDMIKEYKYEHSNTLNPPIAIFANVHGDIQVKFEKKTIHGQYVSIQSLQDLASILQVSESCNDELDFDEEPFNAWGYHDKNGFPASPFSRV